MLILCINKGIVLVRVEEGMMMVLLVILLILSIIVFIVNNDNNKSPTIGTTREMNSGRGRHGTGIITL